TNVELEVEVQYALDSSNAAEGDIDEPPSPELLTEWAQSAHAVAVTSQQGSIEVTIRLVAQTEIQSLNLRYRGKDKPTNVLSFPMENDFVEVIESIKPNLGDIVICHPIIVEEAKQQKKSIRNHYAHMVTHGILHLCGFDHQDDLDAEKMEAMEIEILTQNNVPNPYLLAGDLS
nr:rRNA maturation RNase YbeY [Acidiferrobacterales bacterium]